MKDRNLHSVLCHIRRKYYTSLLIVFLILTNSNLHGQQVFTKDADGIATVIRGVALSLVGSNSLDFGEVVVTSSSQTLTITNQNGQKFKATGQRGTSVTITYPSTVTLSNSAWVAQNGGTISTLTFTSSTLKRTGTNSNYQNAQNVVSGNSYNLPNLNNVGTLYLWAGGSITVSANKPHGVYEGAYTISITY